MKKEYIMQGLDCANCANKIETAVSALPDVLNVTLNFMTTTLQVEIKEETTEDGIASITAEVKKVVAKFEPDVVVVDKEQLLSDPRKTDHKSNLRQIHYLVNPKKIVQLLIGTAILVLAVIISKTTVPSLVVLAFFILSYLILGGEVLLKALKNIRKGQIFDENFLMSIATIGAFAIGDFPEAVSVMLFYQIGEYFQEAAVRKSKKSISELMDIRPDFAVVQQDQEWVRVAPEQVKVGDIILVKPGEKIPLDGKIIEGISTLDTKALTGESLPRNVEVDDQVLSGCINQSGVLTIQVTNTFGESTVAKIIDLVENATSKKAPTENFISTFSRYYTPIVVIAATLLAIIPPLLLGGVWSEWIHRGLIFLVISCPCALVISIPLSFFGGIGAASKKGILVKGSSYLEALNNLDIIVFDKTGTLTKGVFEVTHIENTNGFEAEEVLELTAYAEAFSNHPIALSIQKAYTSQQPDGAKIIDKTRLQHHQEIAGYGIQVSLEDTILLAGNDKLMAQNQISTPISTTLGTKIYLAVNHVLAGIITISDQVKPDSKQAIANLKNQHIRKTVMLTGDNDQIGQAIGKELGIDEIYTQLLPHQKVEKVENLEMQKRAKGKLAFVGDGINDAPVLARSDIGIAMGGLGSDAAIEAADVVIMTDEPNKIVEAIKIAQSTKRIVWQNIIFALGVKGIFLLLGALGIATMWEAVFADVGVSVLAILNAMRIQNMK